MHSNPDLKSVITERTQSFRLIVWLASITMMTVGLPLCAFATLGENWNSTEADRASMTATLRMLPAAKFNVHEIQTPYGTTLREYVSTAGTVFAVAWRGPVMPDLRQLLGSYFDRYVEAAGGKHAGTRHLAISDPGLVVQSSGRMRSFSGRAYLPQLLPQGVTAGEIR